MPRHCVAYRVEAAVAVVVALWTPETRVTCALARLLVTFALLACAWVLTVGSPTIRVAGTLASQVITLAIGVTITLALAVGTPKLGRTL